MEVSEWKTQIQATREQKDAFFKMHVQSPLPLEEREKFKGLSYYPPAPEYRFEMPLYEHEEKKTLKVEDTQGKVRVFLRWGEFRFTIKGTHCTLQAYKSAPEEERLFIPFRDATSGKETYGAGRYLDLEPGHDVTSEGTWMIDFNHAYNPWCAYSEHFACPYTPSENWLEAAIYAGEKNYR